MWPEIENNAPGMHSMGTMDSLDAHNKPLHSRTTNENIGFPSITQNDKTKKRMFVRRNKTFSVRVPPTGHEYDFRRTPDGTGRTTPRMIRPCVPPDTLGIDRLHLNNSPALSKHRTKVKPDVNIPAPAPSESNTVSNEYDRHMDISAPLPTARSAWDRTNVAVADDEEDTQIDTSRVHHTRPEDTYELKDNAGRRLKPATKNGGDYGQYEVIVSDVEMNNYNYNSNNSSQTFGNLTEDALYMHNNRPVNRDKRIARWLADMRDQKCNQVPAHLPEISNSRKLTMLSVEDV